MIHPFFVELTLVRKEVENLGYTLYWEGTDNSGALMYLKEVYTVDNDEGAWEIGDTRTMSWGEE